MICANPVLLLLDICLVLLWWVTQCKYTGMRNGKAGSCLCSTVTPEQSRCTQAVCCLSFLLLWGGVYHTGVSNGLYRGLVTRRKCHIKWWFNSVTWLGYLAVDGVGLLNILLQQQLVLIFWTSLKHHIYWLLFPMWIYVNFNQSELKLKRKGSALKEVKGLKSFGSFFLWDSIWVLVSLLLVLQAGTACSIVVGWSGGTECVLLSGFLLLHQWNLPEFLWTLKHRVVETLSLVLLKNLLALGGGVSELHTLSCWQRKFEKAVYNTA